MILCLLLQMYNFTSFTVSLNELETGMEKILAPTDCRLRPDIRGMENGNMGAWPWLSGRALEGNFTSCRSCFSNRLWGKS